MQRKTIAYILVFACVIIAIFISSMTVETLSLNLQLSLDDPDISSEEKLNNAKFLYSLGPFYLDRNPHLKNAVREEIVARRIARQTEDEDSSREELMKTLIDNENNNPLHNPPDKNTILLLVITITLGLLGTHYIAVFITTDSWSKIKNVPRLPFFTIGFGIISLFVFISTLALSFFTEFFGPIGHLAPFISSAIILLLISRHAHLSGTYFWRAIGLTNVDYYNAVKVGIVGFLIFFPMQYILQMQGTILSYYLGRVPAGHPFIEEFISTSSIQLRLIISFLVLISAPFFEEIFFRGIFLQSVEQKLRPELACVLCGLVFGMVHGSFLNIFVVSFLGFLMAFLMQKTRSIVTPIVLHFLFNAHSMIQVILLR